MYESTLKRGGTLILVSIVTCSVTFPVPDRSENREETGTSQVGRTIQRGKELSVMRYCRRRNQMKSGSSDLGQLKGWQHSAAVVCIHLRCLNHLYYISTVDKNVGVQMSGCLQAWL